jgi:hypothetical protein
MEPIILIKRHSQIHKLYLKHLLFTLLLFLFTNILNAQCPAPVKCTSGTNGDIVNIILGGIGGNKTFATFDWNTDKISFLKPLSITGNLTTTGTISGNGSGLTNIIAANVTGNFNTINAGSNNITTTGTISGNAANIKGLLTVYGSMAFNIITSDNAYNAISFYKKEATSIWDYANRSGWIGFVGNDIVLQNEAGGNTYIGGTKVVLGNVNAASLSTTGNVAIGTTTARTGCALTVNGKIAAEEFEVVNDVTVYPDFVFESNYKLRPLKDLEQFVKGQKHLPDVPSAKQFKEDGYKVAEMNSLLLQKVEELSLYVIALNKQVEELKAEMAKGGK